MSHGCVVFQMAEAVVPRYLFADILRPIAGLRAPPAPAWGAPLSRKQQHQGNGSVL